ncbi:MAG: elongation factor P--(R)-beta-lysine ligase [Aquificaceae bacterium]|nr:elongation factor P--(R)-beta-lysine ligase [Aquificaceae bacterium]MCX7990394.1 elongation factor P--(R)-beta-lysine ligase [Aquificaceae bacterium]MDW8294842.1 elongation factor P--(R)-beta-lysine ligase [Aquificaceae bacterium]
MLSEWSEFLHRIREFFIQKGYLEVHTPLLLPYPNIDPNVEPVELTVRECGKEKRLWLQTSPEFSMKKLLSKHRRDIFQITKVFRNWECGKLHRIEFTMLEWYKLDVGYEHIIQEIGELMSYLGLAEGYKVTRLEHAFEEHAGVVLSEEEEVFKNNLLAYGYEFDDKEDWENLFFRIYIEVERKLGFEEPEFLTHFPKRLSSYAKVEKGYAERFELYIRGVEIANGWTEERDPQEIRRRMEVFRGGRDLPIDEELLRAYQNFPPCAGCSIGLERLFMVYMGLESLEELYF